MALGTYQELLDSIPVWLHRQGDDEVIAAAPDMITLAESEIYVKLRTRYQEQEFSFSIFNGAPLPPDYIDLKYAYIDGTPITNLKRASPDFILSQYPYRSPENRPEFIARDGEQFIFGPFPDSNYTVKGRYYGATLSLAALAVNSPVTSPLLSRYPKAFLFGALSKAEMLIRNDPSIDAMMPVWKGEFSQAIQEAQDENDRELMSGGSLQMHVVGCPP